MKYKKQIATGALALSLLVGGSTVFAVTPEDLGVKNVPSTYQKSHKINKNGKGAKNIVQIKRNNTVGIISIVNDSGFVMDINNIKAKTVSSIDVKTDSSTSYSKNGVKATASDLIVGQKVIVFGSLDKTTNILTAKKVKIVTTKVVKTKS